MSQKARYWVGVCWVDSMIENWDIKIGDFVQLPFAYCLHDKDQDTVGDQRKPHIHLILCWNNTTTYKAALGVFNRLSREGVKCCNAIQEIVGMRNQYEYLIHNTDAARADGKHQYSPDERITGNNFDIGFLEQFSLQDKDIALRELIELIKAEKLFNMLEFYDRIMQCEKDALYLEVLKGYSGLLQKMLDANYQRLVRAHFFDKPVTDPGADRRAPAQPAGSDEQQSGSSKNGQ